VKLADEDFDCSQPILRESSAQLDVRETRHAAHVPSGLASAS
jgi:hypothetical protein